MTFIIICSLLCFLLYFLSCSPSLNVKKKVYSLVLFVIFTIIIRSLIEPKYNNDYYLYFDFKIFGKPTSILSFILNEPYLYGLYRFFSLFSSNKSCVFQCMYWLNHIITTSFFVWLALREDVAKWKKIVLFVLFYPVLDFVLLRNGPVYLLFALYFYYSFRNKKFKSVLFSPLIHFSSLLLLPVFFYRIRNYYFILCGFILFAIALFFIFVPYLQKIDEFQRLIFKMNAYSNMENLNVKMHSIFLGAILFATILFLVIYKQKLFHPIIVFTFLLYFGSFFFNVSVAYRLAVYYIFALFLFGSIEHENTKLTKWLNILAIFLFPVFLYSFSITHKTFVRF